MVSTTVWTTQLSPETATELTSGGPASLAAGVVAEQRGARRAGASDGDDDASQRASAKDDERDGPWNQEGLRERLVVFARRLVGESDAEDLAQEALMRAACNLRRLRSVERTEAWLFRICRHAAIDHLRARRVRHGVWVPMPAEGAEWAPSPTPAPTQTAAAPVYDDLSAHQALLLRLHHLRGLSQARLCLHSGLTAPALRVRLFRARRVLAGGERAIP